MDLSLQYLRAGTLSAVPLFGICFWEGWGCRRWERGEFRGTEATDKDFGWCGTVLIAVRSFDMIAYTEWV